MCGIFGIHFNPSQLNASQIHNDLRRIFLYSQERGQDSSGLVVKTDKKIHVLKKEFSAKILLESKELSEIIKSISHSKGNVSILGQCRLVTDGSMNIESNNQPIEEETFFGVHNGIIINTEEIEGDYTSRESSEIESDSKKFFNIISQFLAGNTLDSQFLNGITTNLEGTISAAILPKNEDAFYLYSNFGSLHYWKNEDNSTIVFMSEKNYLNKFLSQSLIVNGMDGSDRRTNKLPLNETVKFEFNKSNSDFKSINIKRYKNSPDKLKRCNSCVLPETYPFISFNEKGVCNYCLNYKVQNGYGREQLEHVLSKHRSGSSKVDCLIGLSGGRDSCYGLHVIKKEFGMNPIAYTYDWGLTTDVARINQAKMLQKLGVEHILRAPDLRIKRRYLRKNIDAWLNRPHLGMVPLFMAGDKDFYQYGRTLRKHVGVDLTIFCAGQQVEQRPFFVGFCGVNQSLQNNTKLYNFSYLSKLKLALFYSSQYLLNYKYINESLYDSVRSFFTSFLLKDDFLYLYRYIKWDETIIEKTLQQEYGWKPDAKYGKNQWRMGDGQTAFTNFIYYHLAGFSEFDEFRSNQIREGMITRKLALELVQEDNRPKYETLNYFGHIVGINIEETLNQIKKIPTLY